MKKKQSLTEQLAAIPAAQVPEAIAYLSARLLREGAPAANGIEERWLEPDEVAARLGVHRREVYKLADQLGGVRLSRKRLRIPLSRLEAYLANSQS